MQKHKRKSIQIPQSTIMLDIMPMLKLRNITKPIAYLLKLGINSVSAQNMVHGKTVQINYNQLTKLCVALNCTPNDLFVLRNLQLPENHALHQLKTIEAASEVISINDWLIGKSVEEVERLLKQ
jgi:DNA-binding Xre family transcriptional regulator